MRKKQSKILDAVHATAKGLHGAGAIDQVTMREFDTLRIAPITPLLPTQIKRIRDSCSLRSAAEQHCLGRTEMGNRSKKRPT